MRKFSILLTVLLVYLFLQKAQANDDLNQIIVIGIIKETHVFAYYHDSKFIEKKDLPLVNRKFLPAILKVKIEIIEIIKNDQNYNLKGDVDVLCNDFVSIIKDFEYYNSASSVISPQAKKEEARRFYFHIKKCGSLELIKDEAIKK